MRSVLDALGGLWELLLLAARSRFRLGGPYWTWHTETAFSSRRDAWPPWPQRLARVLAYGRWVYRMKRGR